MNLDTFVQEGWRDHAADAEAVMARLPRGIDLVATPADLPKLAGLVVHVAGQHLGRWDDGIAMLETLRSHPAFDGATAEGKAVVRSRAVLDYAAGRRDEAERHLAAALTGGALPEASDRIRMLAVASSALLERKKLREATSAFEEAIALAAYGPGAGDPAARALAVTANGMACELENLPERTDDEVALMLLAAEAGLRFWSIAGGWMETERAHYRAAQSFLKAGRAEPALEHARRCVEIVRANGSDPGESFFAHEVLALSLRASGDAAAARASASDAEATLASIEDTSFREYAAGELAKLKAIVAG